MVIVLEVTRCSGKMATPAPLTCLYSQSPANLILSILIGQKTLCTRNQLLHILSLSRAWQEDAAISIPHCLALARPQRTSISPRGFEAEVFIGQTPFMLPNQQQKQ